MAKLSIKVVSGLLIAIITLIILFTILGDTAADVGGAAGNMSTFNASNVVGVDGVSDNDATTTYPLTGFFKRKGIILLALIAGIIIVLITSFLMIGKKGK